MNTINKISNLTLLIGLLTSIHTLADVAPSDYRQKQSDQVWEKKLRPAHFKDKKIVAGAKQNIIELKTPYTAEDATVVPVSIHTKISQGEDQYIKKIYLFVDKNPLPLIGIFEFLPRSGKADLATRIRVDTFSYIRAIAELNTGELYMAKSFIRAKGACSTPPPASIEDSKRLLGKMKIRQVGDIKLREPNLVQLKIRHPNITGMAPIKIGSRVIPPAYYVNALKISYNNNLIMKASLTFGISMDPAFRFFFVPEKEGMLTIEGNDTKNNAFSSSYEIRISS